MKRQADRNNYNDNKYPNVYIFNTFFYEKLKEEGIDYDKILAIWEKKNIVLYLNKYIMIPINYTKKHWALAVVNINEKSITYYDSLSKDGDSVMIKLANLFTLYINKNKNQYEDHLLDVKSNINSDILEIQRKVLCDKNEEEITNKLSTSYSSIINQYNQENLLIHNLSEEYVKEEVISISNDDEEPKISSYWEFRNADCPKQRNGVDCGVFLCKYMDYLSREEPMNFTQDDMSYFRVLIGVEIINGKLLTC